MARVDTIDYVTIASAGNATDFGDLTVARDSASSCSSPTRGLFGGGDGASVFNTIDYITIATTGNASDFGDLTDARRAGGGVSSSTRGVFMGGRDTNIIDYVTIASTGNATDFGDMTFQQSNGKAASSKITGVIAGGQNNSAGDAVVNSITSITIATTGNATDFGDLTQTVKGSGGTSNAHGGLAA